MHPFDLILSELVDNCNVMKNQTFGVHFSTSENDSSYLIRAEVPGFKRDDLKISIRDNRLNISGHQEKSDTSKMFASSISSFEKTYTLPTNATSEISAECQHGILVVSIPKRKPAITEAKQIPILGPSD